MKVSTVNSALLRTLIIAHVTDPRTVRSAEQQSTAPMPNADPREDA
jgi:hypothetical protein